MIRTIRKTNVSHVRAEILKYGKLVLENGRVHPAADYAVTGRSRYLKPDAGLLPFKLLGGHSLDPNQIDPQMRRVGGLFVRRIDLGGKEDSIALMRVRFRSEAGENGTGRPYLQSTTWIVPFAAWRSCPGAVLAQAAERLKAEPDLASKSNAERFSLDDEVLECQDFARYTIDKFKALGEAGEQGDSAAKDEAAQLASVIETILASDVQGAPAVFGHDAFSDEAAFLLAVGRALEIVDASSAADGFVRPDLRIACGLRIGGSDVALRYLSSEKTTATPAFWHVTYEKLRPERSRGPSTSRRPAQSSPGARPSSAVASLQAQPIAPDRSGGLDRSDTPDRSDLSYRPPSRRVLHDDDEALEVEHDLVPVPNGQHELVHQLKDSVESAEPPPTRTVPTGIYPTWRSNFVRYAAEPDDPAKAVELICATVEAYDRVQSRGHPYPDDVVPAHSILEQKHAFLLGMGLCGQIEWTKRFLVREMLSYVAPTIKAYDYVQQELRSSKQAEMILRFAAGSAKVIVARLEELEILCPAESDFLKKAGFFRLGKIVERETELSPLDPLTPKAHAPSPLKLLAPIQARTYSQPEGTLILRRRQTLAEQTNRPDLGPPTYLADPDILTLDRLDRERGTYKALSS